MKNHSPEPFTYCYSPSNPRRAAIKDRYGNSIASLINLSEESYLHQNGALFAAAPELLKALRASLSYTKGTPEWEMAKVAIAKAEGIKK